MLERKLRLKDVRIDKKPALSPAADRDKIKCHCGRSFSNIGDHTYHIKRECGRSFSCNICHNAFSTKSNLSTHYKRCVRKQMAHGQMSMLINTKPYESEF